MKLQEILDTEFLEMYPSWHGRMVRFLVLFHVLVLFHILVLVLVLVLILRPSSTGDPTTPIRSKHFRTFSYNFILMTKK